MAQAEVHLPHGRSKVTMPPKEGAVCRRCLSPPHQGSWHICQQRAPTCSAPQLPSPGLRP